MNLPSPKSNYSLFSQNIILLAPFLHNSMYILFHIHVFKSHFCFCSLRTVRKIYIFSRTCFCILFYILFFTPLLYIIFVNFRIFHGKRTRMLIHLLLFIAFALTGALVNHKIMLKDFSNRLITAASDRALELVPKRIEYVEVVREVTVMPTTSEMTMLMIKNLMHEMTTRSAHQLQTLNLAVISTFTVMAIIIIRN